MKKLILITISIHLGFYGLAQTSNTGMLYVSPGTQFSSWTALRNTSDGSIYNDGQCFLYGDLENKGKYDYYQPLGTTFFVGMEEQEIFGPEPIFLYNASFKNTADNFPFLLYGNLTIENNADFISGILLNRNLGGEIIFGENATHSNTSSQSHVDGQVKKLGTEAFVFPIGNKNIYQYTSLSEAKLQLEFAATYFRENSNEIQAHQQREGVISEIDDVEYWEVVADNNEEKVFLTLPYSEEASPEPILEAVQDNSLTIVRWDPNLQLWTNEGGSVDTENGNITTLTSGLGLFTLAVVKSDEILPCDVTVYTAVTPNGDGNNDFFRIEKGNYCDNRLAVSIYNRWGVKVFETPNYGSQGEVFNGYSNGRLTINNASLLPTGTYYYLLEYDYENDSGVRHHSKVGFFYLSGN